MIFLLRDSIILASISISKNYILGPGDEIVISLWKSNSFSSGINGRTNFHRKVGILNLGGKSSILQNHIISKYSNLLYYWSNLNHLLI